MMNSILNRLKRKADRPNKTDELLPKRERMIPPHIVVCKVCEGKGTKEGATCPQCKGSGRVIVSCEVTTYVSAYVPENNQKQSVMEEKVRIVMELDKNVVQTACFLANINLSDEVWQKMVAEPILFPTELAGEQKKEMELGMAMAALGLTLQKQEETE